MMTTQLPETKAKNFKWAYVQSAAHYQKDQLYLIQAELSPER